MIEFPCIDCRFPVTFDSLPGDGMCAHCGLRLYLTQEGALGRYPDPDWEPGRIQGKRHRP
jgi:hypothetical protein